MLPRRHILDVWETTKNEEEALSMAALSLSIDAMKYMHKRPKKDHLVEALELNEYICFMHPALRPKNRSLLYHVVSDLLGLLMYGVPRTRKLVIENIETVNYSQESMETYPVIEIWNNLKEKVYKKKHGAEDLIEGFIRKIRIEIDTMERHPIVDDIFSKSVERIDEWLPVISGYYDESKRKVKDTYTRWCDTWHCNGGKELVLKDLVERLAEQALREFNVPVDEGKIIEAIESTPSVNKRENNGFSRWYKEGVNFLLKI